MSSLNMTSTATAYAAITVGLVSIGFILFAVQGISSNIEDIRNEMNIEMDAWKVSKYKVRYMLYSNKNVKF